MENSDLGSMKVGIKFDSSQLDAGLKTISKQMSVVDSAVRAGTSGFDAMGKSSDSLKVRIDGLNQKIELQKQKIDLLRQAYNESITTKGEDAVATQNLEIKLNNATAQLNKMQLELKDTNKELKNTPNMFDKIENSMNNFSNKIGTLGKTLTRKLTVPITGVIAGLGVLITKTVDSADELQTMADITGLSAERLQELKYVGSQVDVELETMTNSQKFLIKAMTSAKDSYESADGSLKHVSASATDLKLANDRLALAQKKLTEANKKYGKESAQVLSAQIALTSAQENLNKVMKGSTTGNKPKELNEQAKIFKELGISITDTTGHLRDSNVIFNEVITALGKIQNPAERDAMAMNLFGKSAMELNPLIKAGSAEITRLTEEARKSGAVISNESVAAMDQFGDSIDALKLVMTGMIGKIVAELMPTLRDKLLPVLEEKVIPAIGTLFQKITDVVIWFTNLDSGTQKVILTIGLLLIALGPIASTIANITTIVQGLIAAFGILCANPIILGLAALATVILLIATNWDKVSAAIGGAIDKFLIFLGLEKKGQPTTAKSVLGEFSMKNWKAGWDVIIKKVNDFIFTGTPGLSSGADYIPYDNFLARLHKGERVLTASENIEYSSKTINTTSNSPIILNIENFNNNSNQDIKNIMQQLEQERKQAILAKGGNI